MWVYVYLRFCRSCYRLSTETSLSLGSVAGRWLSQVSYSIANCSCRILLPRISPTVGGSVLCPAQSECEAALRASLVSELCWRVGVQQGDVPVGGTCMNWSCQICWISEAILLENRLVSLEKPCLVKFEAVYFIILSYSTLEADSLYRLAGLWVYLLLINLTIWTALQKTVSLKTYF